jgi:hypothetical protein
VVVVVVRGWRVFILFWSRFFLSVFEEEATAEVGEVGRGWRNPCRETTTGFVAFIG